MKRCKIEIEGKDSKKGFSLNIVNAAWFSLEGNWNCLPGFMPQTSGYFKHDSDYRQIRFYDREMTTTEMISCALTDTESPTKLYLSLDDFTDEPAVGKSGKGSLFSMGSRGKSVFKDIFGFANYQIIWKVTEVF